MQYSEYIVSLTDLLETTATTPEFVNILPSIVNDAEQRMYRELDLLATVFRDNSKSCMAGSRNITAPTTEPNGATWITTQEINVITPAGTLNPELGSRNQLTPVSQQFLNAVYGSNAKQGLPKFFAMVDNTIIIVGPWADKSYTCEFVGTIRPAPISATNPTTILSTYLPDAFLAASMVFASGYQRNFGSASDDPKMALSWNELYGERMKSAMVEAARQRFAASGWSSMAPPIVATPGRGS